MICELFSVKTITKYVQAKDNDDDDEGTDEKTD